MRGLDARFLAACDRLRPLGWDDESLGMLVRLLIDQDFTTSFERLATWLEIQDMRGQARALRERNDRREG